MRALVAALGCVAAPASVIATTWPVGRCSDIAGKGGDTLRIAIGKAGDGDTVDLSSLPVTCSTITLSGGQIPIAAPNLTISGSATSPITINAANASRVFEHTGTGLLNLFGIGMANGNGVGGNAHDGQGGCLRSSGSVLLQYSTATGCQAATGGGMIVYGNLSLIHASISGCSIHYSPSRSIIGGAALAVGPTLISYSTISGNYSQLYTAGIYAGGSITVNASTISGNSANLSTGYFKDGASPDFLAHCTALTGTGSLTITTSTIEGNLAGNPGNASGSLRSAVCGAGTVTIDASTLSSNSGYAVTIPAGATLRNTTVSGNDAALLFFSTSSLNVFSSTFAFNASGMRLSPGSACSLWIESTIMADNSIPISFCSQNKSIKNLGFSPAEVGIAPLAWRGGPTRTHALTLNSPAIDAGSNPASQPFDQRGSGYGRYVAVAPDIGAYERQANDDELFYGGFD